MEQQASPDHLLRARVLSGEVSRPARLSDLQLGRDEEAGLGRGEDEFGNETSIREALAGPEVLKAESIVVG